jgi:hypothetical protein
VLIPWGLVWGSRSGGAAEAEAPLLDSMALKAPPRGGWHDPTNAADLAAYATAVAFFRVAGGGAHVRAACVRACVRACGRASRKRTKSNLLGLGLRSPTAWTWTLLEVQVQFGVGLWVGLVGGGGPIRGTQPPLWALPRRKVTHCADKLCGQANEPTGYASWRSCVQSHFPK